MAQSVTFIHAADLHLGAPFQGARALSKPWAQRLSTAMQEAFDRIVHAAIDRSVDFVVLAGDIFDRAQPSYADMLRFSDGLRRLEQAEIPVYLLSGNHDPLASWQHDYLELPANAHMFPADKPGFFAYSRNGEPLVLLGGRGLYGRTTDEQSSIASGITRRDAQEALGCKAPFCVGVLHTGLDVDIRQAPVDKDTLYAADMDYWALGHVHVSQLDNPRNPRIVFSGCIQGRSINETGARGCWQITLEQGHPNKAEFIPTASVVWQKLSVNASDARTVADIQEAVAREIIRVSGSALCNQMIERVTITGTTPLHEKLRRPHLLDEMRAAVNDTYPTFFCDALIDETRAPIDRASLEAEGLFPAVLIRQARAMQAHPQESIDYLQDEFLNRGLSMPADYATHIEEWLRNGEDLLFDLIAGGVHDE